MASLAKDGKLKIISSVTQEEWDLIREGIWIADKNCSTFLRDAALKEADRLRMERQKKMDRQAKRSRTT